MSATLRFAWKHFRHYRKRSLLLVLSMVLVFLLPVAVKLVVDDFATAMAARAKETPLVVGATGSRYDLVLSSLYFRGRVPEPLSMSDVEDVMTSGMADPIPLHLGHTAKGAPIVGTTHDYYGFRGLSFSDGGAPVFLGEAVLGAELSERFGLGVGDTLLSDQGSVFELSLTYPLQMRIVGVLEPQGSPDDTAVFCDVRTSWILDGLGHGHVDARDEEADRLSAEGADEVVLSPATFQYNAIDETNLESFHLHGDPTELPVSSILIDAHDQRGATILGGRYQAAAATQMLAPSEVVDELLAFVFRLRRFFNVNALFVAAAMALLFGLVFLLSLRLRAAEFDTLHRLGFSRGTVVKLVCAEWVLVLTLGIALVALFGFGLSGLLELYGDRILFGGTS